MLTHQTNPVCDGTYLADKNHLKFTQSSSDIVRITTTMFPTADSFEKAYACSKTCDATELNVCRWRHLLDSTGEAFNSPQ